MQGAAGLAAIPQRLDTSLGLDVQGYVQVLESSTGDAAALQQLNAGAGAAAPRVVVLAGAAAATVPSLIEQHLIAAGRRGVTVIVPESQQVRCGWTICKTHCCWWRRRKEVPVRLPNSPSAVLPAGQRFPRFFSPPNLTSTTTTTCPSPQEHKKRRTSSLPDGISYDGNSFAGRVNFPRSAAELALVGKRTSAWRRLQGGQQTHKASWNGPMVFARLAAGLGWMACMQTGRGGARLGSRQFARRTQ